MSSDLNSPWLCVVHIGDVFITQRYKDCTTNTIHYFRVSIKKTNHAVFKHKPFINITVPFFKSKKNKKQKHQPQNAGFLFKFQWVHFFIQTDVLPLPLPFHHLHVTVTYRCYRCDPVTSLPLFRYRCCPLSKEMNWKFEDLAGNASFSKNEKKTTRKEKEGRAKEGLRCLAGCLVLVWCWFWFGFVLFVGFVGLLVDFCWGPGGCCGNAVC